MTRNSFTLDSDNIDVVIPNRRIRYNSLRKGSKEIVSAGKKVVNTKIKTPRPSNLNVNVGKIPTREINPDVIQMGSRYFTRGKRR